MKTAIKLACVLIVCLAVASATRLAVSARADLADLQEQQGDRRGNGGNDEVIRLPSGQYTTPTAIKDSVQQFLNPGLAAYPDFIAGMAVRSQLSPDGTTLAIITAGQNSLYKPDGTVDAANSTQYIFLYDV